VGLIGWMQSNSKKIMSKISFAFISIIQLIAAFVILLYVWNPELLIFKYRYPFPDPTSMPYYQVDEDVLFVISFFWIPLASFFVLLSIAFVFFLKRVSFRESILAMMSLSLAGIELSICINALVVIAKLSNSLVSCDDLIIGQSLGCYMPSR
jgi:ABC-type Fe3+-siderophore transport system permease subunit